MSGSMASSVIEDPMVLQVTAADSFPATRSALLPSLAMGADDEDAEKKKDSDLDEDDEFGDDDELDDDELEDDEESDDELDEDLDDELIDLDDEYDDVDEDDHPHPGHKFLE